MGLFSNSGKSSEFYDVFSALWKLLADYSYGEISGDYALMKVKAAQYNVLVAAKSFSNPFNETFKLFSNSTSVFGEKITIAEGVAIAQIAIDAVFQGTRLSNQIQNAIIQQAKSVCSTYEGKQSIRQLLENV